jgi:hypothetical protein
MIAPRFENFFPFRWHERPAGTKFRPLKISQKDQETWNQQYSPPRGNSRDPPSSQHHRTENKISRKKKYFSAGGKTWQSISMTCANA